MKFKTQLEYSGAAAENRVSQSGVPVPALRCRPAGADSSNTERNGSGDAPQEASG